MKTITMLLLACSSHGAQLSDLTFMAGCWSGPAMEEHWTKPLAGTMLGMSRSVKGNQTVMTEFHLIREENGAAVLNVQLQFSGKSTPFRLIQSGATEAVFSNPEHDFPQRIIYRVAAGGLFARIEGTVQGKMKGQDFPMKRCP